MTDDKLNGSDIFNSLTGFEEMAITQRFGRPVTDLASSEATMFGRALIFTTKRRDGATDEDAWNAAMGMPLKEVLAIASDADASEEDSGKDEPLELGPEQQHETSLSSVS